MPRYIIHTTLITEVEADSRADAISVGEREAEGIADTTQALIFNVRIAGANETPN